MASQNDSQFPGDSHFLDDCQFLDDYGTDLTSDTLPSAQDLALEQDLALKQDLLLHQDLSSLAGVADANLLRLGEDLRRWQAEERRAALRPLLVPILILARRLLAAHRDWEVQEQMHLDYISLEVRVRPGAEPILIECRWPEDVQLQGTGALELRLAEPPSFDNPVCVLFFKGKGQASLNPAAAEDAQPKDAQPGSPESSDYLEKPMSPLEGFLLQVLGAAEHGAPAQAETTVEAEVALE